MSNLIHGREQNQKTKDVRASNIIAARGRNHSFHYRWLILQPSLMQCERVLVQEEWTKWYATNSCSIFVNVHYILRYCFSVYSVLSAVESILFSRVDHEVEGRCRDHEWRCDDSQTDGTGASLRQDGMSLRFSLLGVYLCLSTTMLTLHFIWKTSVQYFSFLLALSLFFFLSHD
jgi:hypothetical protein